MKKLIKRSVFMIENGLITFFSLFSIQKNWIMLDSWNGKEFSGDIKMLYDVFVERFSHPQYIIVGKKTRNVGDKTVEVSRGSLKYYYFRACSRYYITNYYYVNQLSKVKIRKGTEYILVWHAAGILKKIGKSVLDEKGRKSIDKAGKKISKLIVSSELVRTVYSQDLGVERGRVLPLGIPRSDYIVHNADKREDLVKSFATHCFSKNREIASTIKTRYEFLLKQFSKGRKIILYAPTIRDDKSVDFLPDFFHLQHALGKEYIIILQLHPMSVPYEVASELNEFVFQIEGVSSEALMIISDILITDYSSLIFDFAFLKRPMVFYIPDGTEYISQKGFYIDFFENTPGEKVTNQAELVEAILESEKRMIRFEKVRERILEYAQMDGKACERFVKEIFKEQMW